MRLACTLRIRSLPSQCLQRALARILSHWHKDCHTSLTCRGIILPTPRPAFVPCKCYWKLFECCQSICRFLLSLCSPVMCNLISFIVCIVAWVMSWTWIWWETHTERERETERRVREGAPTGFMVIDWLRCDMSRQAECKQAKLRLG